MKIHLSLSHCYKITADLSILYTLTGFPREKHVAMTRVVFVKIWGEYCEPRCLQTFYLNCRYSSLWYVNRSDIFVFVYLGIYPFCYFWDPSLTWSFLPGEVLTSEITLYPFSSFHCRLFSKSTLFALGSLYL